MIRIFPNASVAAATDADNEVTKIHEGDRHVALTAIASNADSILTINQRHFPKTALQHHNIAIVTLGEFIQTLIKNDTHLVMAALEQLARRWQNPPHTIDQIIDLISNHPTMNGRLAHYRHTPDPPTVR